jgi:5-methyltetrahydrofolate--homocysteine methyltransferase
MTQINIPDFDRKKTYFKAFWENEVLDRPLISVRAPLNDKLVPLPYLYGVKSGNYLEALQRFVANMENTYYGGEALPFYECVLGPDQFASFLGGIIEYSEEAATSWVRPFWNDDYTEESVILDTSPGGNFDTLMNYIKTATAFASGRFLISMPDLHGNMDAIMAARGSQNLCFDLADDPDKVQRVLDRILPLFPQIVKRTAEMGNMDDTGYIGWISTYSEERFAVLQCDFSIMVSPEMTRRFIVPALEYEASCLKHNIYHYDGVAALAHLDDILAIKAIDAIQWVPGAGQPRTVEWIDLLKKTQKAGKRLWLYDWTPQEIKDHFRELDPKGLYFETSTKTPQEADELITYVRNHT